MQYLQQDCQLTLQQGLDEYNKSYPFLNNNDGHAEASKWFKNHDITHVIFGTVPFDIRGESINDTWTLFGSDVTFKGYKEFFKYVDYKTVINSYIKKYKTKSRVYLKMATYIPDCLIAFYRAKRMSKKWHWYHYDEYLNMPLAQLRKEFNINVMKS